MATIGKVSAVFSASTSGLVSGTNAAGSAFRKLAGDVSSLRGGMRSLVAIQGAQLFANVASSATSAARSFARMGLAQADVIDGQSDLAKRLGMTYGELAGLGFAGQQVGVSMETIGKAATRADIAFVKASQGSKQAQAAFAGIGLSVQDLEGLSPAERFRKISDAISALPTAAERSAAAVGVFGRAGAELLPMFEGGAGAITAATDEAARLGLALTDVQAGNVNAMSDSFDKASMAVQGVIGQVVAYLAPAVQMVTDTFTNLIGGIGGANIGQFIGEGIMIGAEFLAGIADWLIAGLTQVWEYVSQVGSQWSGVFSLGDRVAAFFAGVGNVMKAGFYGLLLGLNKVIEGLAYIISQAGQYLGFDTSFIDAVVEGSKAVSEDLSGRIAEAGNEARKNFGVAFGEAKPEEAKAGPVRSMVQDAMRAAREAAMSTSTAPKAEQKPPEPVFTGPSTEALKATDSRSREGIAEMFRLMRGESGDVQEQQLGVLEQIRDAVSEGDPMDTFAFGG